MEAVRPSTRAATSRSAFWEWRFATASQAERRLIWRMRCSQLASAPTPKLSPQDVANPLARVLQERNVPDLSDLLGLERLDGLRRHLENCQVVGQLRRHLGRSRIAGNCLNHGGQA